MTIQDAIKNAIRTLEVPKKPATTDDGPQAAAPEPDRNIVMCKEVENVKVIHQNEEKLQERAVGVHQNAVENVKATHNVLTEWL